jgi:DNA modification methylase
MEVLELNPDSIVVPLRARKQLGDIEELANSIKEVGQIHAIRVTVAPDSGAHVLVAGERRLRACQKLGIKVQAIIREKTSESELKEIELRENLDRQDMSWQEKVAGLAELDELKRKEFGDAKGGRSDVGWSIGDTAKITGEDRMTVHNAVSMAKAIKAFPELATLKTQNDAVKKLNKIKETLAIEELTKRRKEKATGLAILADEHFIIGDAFEGLAKLPDESVDFCNVDTPYGIDLQDQKKNTSEVRTDDDYKEWPREAYLGNIEIVATQCFRILKPNRWMVFWFGIEWYYQVKLVLEGAGFKIDKLPAIWYGGLAGAQTMSPDINLGRAYEPFFICRKGDPVLLKRGRVNVFAYDKVPPQHKIHPTEKPIELMSEIYSTFILPGQIIAVPFIGSGNDLRAAYKYGSHAFGFDLNNDVKNRFLLRVEQDIKDKLYGGKDDS